ncbi:TrkH family potassium uptake protein [Paenibacillus arenilitoris]|uniref:TrkH family potassium uptake protein n=1 Tax=Paenibacillus arenilitoris TaxID=2772299 RepID=A0A927H543_9BACL|nr:TrkH family potassium uptake protein [Paenibacillus arenilitoris]MBD2868143.1 TrkH family potassium uptake protein [Paenibacillus arenilitoris]
MKEAWKVWKWSPPRILVSGFALIILLGAFLLSLPFASATGVRLPFIDALFTATSATCVTGLVVVDSGTYFSVAGQIILMCLIQLGGLGFMTMATLIALVLRKKISLRERLILQEAMNQTSMEGIVRLIRRVIVYSLSIELIGAALFSARFAFDMPLGKAMFFGAFHSISAFNNAGFDIFGDFRSLTLYTSDPIVNLTAILLVVFGGLGFVVMSDLLEFRKKRKLSLHSKVVLTMTGSLIAVGTLVFFIFEFTNHLTLGSLDWGGKLFSSLFQAVMPRTAGYNSIDLTVLRQATQFLIILLMFIGASPGSTGGGIKTTTFAVLIGAVFSMIRGREDIILFRHRLGKDRIFKALTITMLCLGLVIVVTMLLSMLEDHSFLVILFEATSAFATVGLSLGLTPELSEAGKIIIILTMFAGRLGPLTLAYALGPRAEKELYRHPEGKITIG